MPTAAPRLFKWAGMRSIKSSEAATFFGELGRQSFCTEPHLSDDEQALIDGPLSWEIVSDDAQPKLKRRLQSVGDDNEEARSSPKRQNISQELQLAIVPEQQPGRPSSSNEAFQGDENSEIIDLLKQLLTRVDRMERSIAEVQGSVERQESNIAKLSTTVDEIKSQLLPKSDNGEQPSVHLKTPASSKKVRFVETESAHKPSSPKKAKKIGGRPYSLRGKDDELELPRSDPEKMCRGKRSHRGERRKPLQARAPAPAAVTQGAEEVPAPLPTLAEEKAPATAAASEGEEVPAPLPTSVGEEAHAPLPAVTAAAALLDISTGMLDAPLPTSAGKVRPLLVCTHTHLLYCWITEHLQHTSRTPPMLVSLMMPDHRTPPEHLRTPPAHL